METTNGKSINKQKTDPIPLSFEYKGKNYNGIAKPIIPSGNDDNVSFEMDIILDGKFIGIIYCGSNLIWTMKGMMDQGFVDKIGEEIILWNE